MGTNINQNINHELREKHLWQNYTNIEQHNKTPPSKCSRKNYRRFHHVLLIFTMQKSSKILGFDVVLNIQKFGLHSSSQT